MENKRIAVKDRELLNKLYKNFKYPSAFTSLEPLLKEAQKHSPKISRSTVRDYLKSQYVYTKHRKAVRRFKRLPTFSPGPNTVWQADLGVMIKLATRNKNFNYYLLCIDCFSRMIYVKPIKKKTGEDVINGFEAIFKRVGKIPWKIITDAGREFIAANVQKYFRQREIKHYCEYTSPKWHAGMAERANRTVRERLYRYFTEEDHRRWIPVIHDIVTAINNSPNRSLGGMTPMDIHLDRNGAVDQLREQIRLQTEMSNKLIRKREKSDANAKSIRTGTHVRIENNKHAFQKGYLGNFTSEIFTIYRRRKSTKPITYKLIDDSGELVKGWFYRQDLSPVYGRQGNRNWEIEKILKMENKRNADGQIRKFAFVKWKGFDDAYNSWIPIKYIEEK